MSQDNIERAIASLGSRMETLEKKQMIMEGRVSTIWMRQEEIRELTEEIKLLRSQLKTFLQLGADMGRQIP